jgi:hypothetical protein
MIRYCWKSFCPKNATSGFTMLKSLETTLITPRKWSGRNWPHSFAGRSFWSTNVANPLGYISATEGAKSTSTFSLSAIRWSFPIWRG